MKYTAFLTLCALTAAVAFAYQQKEAPEKAKSASACSTCSACSKCPASQKAKPKADAKADAKSQPCDKAKPAKQDGGKADKKAGGKKTNPKACSPKQKAKADPKGEPCGDANKGDKPDAKTGDKAKPDEPLLLLDDEPLLLLDEGEDPNKPKKPMADNSRCHVCHLNYIDEKIAVVHARANIGCAKCHGKCDEHIADESWASGGNGTAPEIMYPPDKINPCCLKCHEGKMDPDIHEDFFAKKTKEKVCTDCHGDHRLKKRMCKWK